LSNTKLFITSKAYSLEEFMRTNMALEGDFIPDFPDEFGKSFRQQSFEIKHVRGIFGILVEYEEVP